VILASYDTRTYIPIGGMAGALSLVRGWLSGMSRVAIQPP
jgi:hypothetical protein